MSELSKEVSLGGINNLPSRRVKRIIVQAHSPAVDDITIKIGDTVLHQGGLNVTWYYGEDIVFTPGDNPANVNAQWETEGFRKVTIEVDDAMARNIVKTGANVNVYVFDGWGPEFRFFDWTATVVYADNHIQTETYIAADKTVQASSSPDSGEGDYLTTGPHFSDEYLNGTFTINPDANKTNFGMYLDENGKPYGFGNKRYGQY